MFEILVQKRKHYPVINSEKHFQVKERGERVQETAPRKPKDEEGSTEIPVYVRETSLSSDGRARGYIECVREMEEFHFFAHRYAEKRSADRTLPSSPKITELLAHGRSTTSENAYATVRPSRLLQN